MRKLVRRLWRGAVFVSCSLSLMVGASCAQQENEPGRSIGKVSTKGDLIVMELDDGVLGKANLFDLTGRTLRFKHDGSRYRVEVGPLDWESDYGSELAGAEASLQKFAFPFPASRGSRSLWGRPDRSDSARRKRMPTLTPMVIATEESFLTGSPSWQ